MSTDDSPTPKHGTKFPELFQALADPFEPSEVKVRTLEKSGRKIQYITARTAMNRLDSVLGPENWWDTFEPHENSVICQLTIVLPDGRSLTKVDAGGHAGMSDQGDDEKSGYSDAFKRACVKFGVARYLYRDGVPSYSESDDDATVHGGQSTPTPEPPAPQSSTPHTGRAFFAWLKEQEERTKPGLIRYLNGWAKLQEFPARMVDWDTDQVSLGVAEAIRKLGTLTSNTAEPVESQLFEPLPHPPLSGKALFAQVMDLQQQHSIELVKEVNAWAKDQGHKDRMVEWPATFVSEAWLFVSAKVRKHLGESPTVNGLQSDPAPNGVVGVGSDIKELRAELHGWCVGTVCNLYGYPTNQTPPVPQVQEEVNRVAALVTPGRTIATFKDLTDADDLRALIVKAQDRFTEVRDKDIPF